MAKIKLNEKQKKLDIDLCIIAIVSFVSLGIFMVFQKEIYDKKSTKNNDYRPSRQNQHLSRFSQRFLNNF